MTGRAGTPAPSGSSTVTVDDPRQLLFREQVRRGAVSPPGDAPRELESRPVPAGDPERSTHLARHNQIIAVLVGAVVALVTGTGVATGPIRFDDEGTYISQALAVLDGSLAPYTYWYDHPPLGWIIIAGWMGGPGAFFPGPNPIATGRYFMVLVTALTAAAVVFFLRRLDVSRIGAAAGGLLFGLCPLGVQFHRMVMLDNLAVLFMMLAWMLAATRSRRLAATAAAGFCLALAVMCKETLLLLAPFVVWMSWRSYRGGTRSMAVTVFGLCFVLPAAFYPLFALLRGELLPGDGHVSLWDGIAFQLFTRQPSGSVFDPSSDAHAVVTGWFATDWYLLAAGAASLPFLLLRRRRWPFAAAVLLSGLMLLRPGYLPVPYVVVLVPLAAIAVAVAVDDVVRFAVSGLRGGTGVPRRAAAALAGLAVLAGAAVVLPRTAPVWVWRDAVYMNHDFDVPYRESTAWLVAHTSADDVVVADNVTWTDLVNQHGRSTDHTIWFTKLGADSQVDARVTAWQQIDYIVVSDIMATSDRAAILQSALDHSTVVASWGQGSQAVTIRKVTS